MKKLLLYYLYFRLRDMTEEYKEHPEHPEHPEYPFGECNKCEFHKYIDEGLTSCICKDLIEQGNCPNCLFYGDYCKCIVEYHFYSKEIEESVKCPISYNVFIDPVVCSDGHTYERSFIENWLYDNNKSPMTGDILSSKELYPNHLIRSLIKNCKKTYT